MTRNAVRSEAMKYTIPTYAKFAIERLQSHGYEAYVVGGCVRDFVRGVSPHDYDMTTSALPSRTKEVFSDFHVIETGIAHGTVTVVIDGNPLEITTFRIDGEYKDNRRPESVSFTQSIVEDLARRDFTINAMAYNDNSGIVDPFGGMQDIEKKLIRCVGEPDIRFDEDGLRILRGLRFSSVLDFDIDEKTKSSIMRKKEYLASVSSERVYVEFTKLLCGQRVGKILCEYEDVIEVFVKQKLDARVFEVIDKVKSDAILRYSALLCFCDCDEISLLFSRLKADAYTRNAVISLVNAVREPLACDRISIKRFISKYGYGIVESFVQLKSALCADFDWHEFLRLVGEIEGDNCCLQISQLDINGNVLIENKIARGKAIGEILRGLLECVISEEIENNREALLKKAREFYDEKTQ